MHLSSVGYLVDSCQNITAVNNQIANWLSFIWHALELRLYAVPGLWECVGFFIALIAFDMCL